MLFFPQFLGPAAPLQCLRNTDEGHGYAKKKNQDFLLMFIQKYLIDKN